MPRLFKSDNKKLTQATIKIQAELDQMIMAFLNSDKYEIKSRLDNLGHQSQLIDSTLLSIQDSSTLLGRIYWKKQNQRLIYYINRSCSIMNKLMAILKDLYDGVGKGSICESSICSLAVYWHNFLLSFKRMKNELAHQPVRRKRLVLKNC